MGGGNGHLPLSLHISSHNKTNPREHGQHCLPSYVHSCYSLLEIPSWCSNCTKGGVSSQFFHYRYLCSNYTFNPFLPIIVEHLSLTGHWNLDPQYPLQAFSDRAPITLQFRVKGQSVHKNSDKSGRKKQTNRGKTLYVSL
jgi:hypothetical protein